MAATVHIVGAGIAGLAAAVRLAQADRSVVVHEATGHPGGRCRSYYDAATDLMIDNGNHLLLSGNRAALAYLRTIGAEHRLVGPPEAAFPFVDFASGERWTLRVNEGRVPWWVFDRKRRVPDTRTAEYAALSRLLWSNRGRAIGDVIACAGPLYERLMRPLLLAALNVDPPLGSAALAGAVIRETLAAGGGACRPLVAREGLGHALVKPAVEFLKSHNIDVRQRHELHRIGFGDAGAAELDFGDDRMPLQAGDGVILAVPAYAAGSLVPDLRVPDHYSAILNAHFRIEPPGGMPLVLGVINATSEWIFAFPHRLSVTVSAGDRLLATPREALARTIWDEVRTIAGLDAPLPPWQFVRERRATFAATPAQNALRPPAETRWRNLFLAGDWTATGLPATIEGAVRSGNRAAELALQLPDHA